MQAASDSRILAEFITRDDVANELGVNPRTLDRWHQLRQGPVRTRIGKRVLYAQQDLRDWITANREVNLGSQHSGRRSRQT